MANRNEQQMATIATRRMKDLHLEIATKWGIPASVLANSTFGLGVTMMRESGFTEEEILDIAHQILDELSGSPGSRGAS